MVEVSFIIHLSRNIMKSKISIILLVLTSLVLSACAFYVDEDSYAMAAQGQTSLTYSFAGADKALLQKAVVMALQERGWIVESNANPVKAKLDKGRHNAVASFAVSDNSIVVDTKGSMVDGNKPYVPKRYVDFVLKSVRSIVTPKVKLTL